VPVKYATRQTPGLPGKGLLLGLILAAGTLPAASAWGQAGIDLEDGTRPAPLAPPGAPAVNPPPAATDRRDTIVDGIRYGIHTDDPAGDKLVPPASTITTTTTTAPPQLPPPQPVVSLPDPVNIDHPKVLNTARLSGDGKVVSLFGIVGQEGEPAQQLEAYLTSANARLTCPAQTSTDFVCLLQDGTDVAAIALANGAARAREDAPDAYKAQEADARNARRGMWASLPPPPDTITHPTVQDTATLVSGTQRYILDGVMGFGQPYAAQLQGYIVANGDRLTCQAQGIPGHYICILDDGTDIAKVSLVNGAARAGQDAPDSYRLEQLDALNNHRGFWLRPPPNVARADRGPPPVDACCVFAAGDDGADGIRYVGGEPTALIGGQTVFLVLAGAAGWGYYDRERHWRDAPGGFRSHLERFHPNGSGLRAYRAGGGAGHFVATGVGRPGVVPGGVPSGLGVGGVRPGFVTGGVRPGVGPSGVPPGVGAGGVRPGFVTGGVRPGVGGPGTFHASGVVPHASPTPFAATHSSVSARPGDFGPPAHAGGFVRPAVTPATTFHPAGLPAPHVAAAHPAVPAVPLKHR
jgi:endonuclease YncB( thermonuclease family)